MGFHTRTPAEPASSPLKADGGDVDATVRLLGFGEPGVGNAQGAQAHSIRLVAELRHLPLDDNGCTELGRVTCWKSANVHALHTSYR